MAHGDDIRRKVRASFVFDQLSLETAAAKHGIPYDTVRTWKRDAKKAGDDWDKARSAQMIAGGGIEDVVRQTLAVVVQQVQATVELIQNTPDMPPSDKVQALASLADAYNKMMAASKRLMPETDAMAVQLDTLKRYAEFVRAKYPAQAAAMLETLEAFGEVLANG